jgi:hypothetical protein
VPINHGDLAAGIATSVFDFASTLVSVVVSWTREANAEARRIRLLERATKQFQFWDSWLKVSSIVAHTMPRPILLENLAP